MKKGVDFLKRNFFEVVVKIHMGGPRNDHQLLVVSGQFLEGVLAEIAGMRLLAVDQQTCRADFTAVCKKRRVEKGKSRSLVPSPVGVQGTRMIATGAFCSRRNNL